MPQNAIDPQISRLKNSLKAKNREIAQLQRYIETLEQRDQCGLDTVQPDVTDEVTRYKNIEQALLESERQFRSVFQNAPDALVIVNKNGSIEMVNEQAQKLFGYSTTDLLTKPVETLLPKELAKVHRSARESYFRTPYCRFMGEGRELIAQTKDGSRFPVEISLSPIQTRTGWLIIAAVRDIRQRKQVEMELENYRQKLEELVADRTMELLAVNKQLESFSYSVSHDLRTPLRGIDGFSAILLQDYSRHLPAEAQNFLYRIRNASQRMGNMIDELLQLARVNRLDLNKNAVNLSDLAKAVIEELSAMQPDRVVNIHIGENMHGVMDATLMRIVLENLLGNAWKFSVRKTPSEIIVDCKQEGNKKVFYVEDNGVGFDMKYADKLFGVFQRLHSHEDFPGTGIGLVTVQRIIERHGGRIWVKSKPDFGTTFYFTLSE